ncbi:MAG: cadmium-translocating P-type ATPase [Candidatus Methanomethylophilus sp.]|nr:cadmium-translocating P-type ATPase [Methanomethylophilus sp.]
MKHKYRVEIDCANCAREVEAALNELPEVESAVLSYVNKTLVIDVSNELEVEYPQIEKMIRDTATSVESDFRMWSEEDAPKRTGTRYEYDIEIDCANCAREVEEAISKLPGIRKASIVYVDKRMVIEISEKDASRYDEIEENVRKTAMAVEPDFRIKPRGSVEEVKNEKSTLIPRIAVGAAFVAFGLILEFFMDWEVSGWDVPGIGMRLLFFAGLMVVGYDVIFNAVRNIGRARFLDENFLMMVATVGAIIIGEYPESVAVMMFYQIGEYFEGRAVAKTRTAVKALVNLKVPYALVERDGKIISVKTETIQVGEHVLIKPGEMVPVDGRVVAGNSFVDTKAMTGEAVPRHVRVGDEVFGGYINTEATIRIEALRPYQDSAAAKVLSIIEESAARKSTSERFITKFSKYYTPIVVFGALALSLIPSLIHLMDPSVVSEGWEYWVNKGLIFLVVSCPCALVVSVPLSYFCGIGNASKKGILIKGSNYIEAISKTECVVFDKTGTLTKGEFKVHRVEPVGMTEGELMEYAASVEIHSNHPIAKSICSYAGKKTADGDVETVNVSGKGVTAKVDGRDVAVGNAGLMADLGITHGVSDEVGTHVYVAVDGAYAGHILISDSLKDDAKQAIADLKGMGISSHMLTGDTAAVGHRIAEELGLDGCETDLLPGDKTASLERIMGSVNGSTAFVGDGINDAPSLARADVGCAMGGLGSDAAVEAADLVIIDDKPSKVAEAVRISKKTQSIVWQNIVMALVIKFAILGLTTFTDLVNMWIAVFGDVGVLILAVANATRALGGFRLNSGKEQPETCGCGHDHQHGEGCGCGHDHGHSHEECSCGHDHHHDDGECGCGCHEKK